MRSREYGDQYPSAAICPRLKIKKPCILICSSSILSRKFKIDVEGIPKFSGVVCENSLFLFIQFPFFMCNIYRSEEHTSELQSRGHLVCRLLLEKKNVTN